MRRIAGVRSSGSPLPITITVSRKSSIERLSLKKMRGGDALPEVAIDTEDGTKSADVAWMSDAFLKANKGRSSFQHAPEICAEVKLPSATLGELLEKADLYSKAGAQEVWIREESGRMLFFDADSLLERSGLCPAFPKTVKA